ncbi:putative cleavage and polyadenylation protein [Thermochaetoides thermophila DSM 1495]|uniref:Cleavage and polyadenylation specificity factor subunit 2 n=1 Tax=Chaetomium thermophilum (strain DSM 1495 / CBS 144.50 / IMI 039719) TaxID=759272 RepID=G0S2F2_CHATD|nr:putative cleavage and polyadenylation protein [Thermochaetoides thermophila DSM 1495]EGS22185.1 putative cleavage and polyadenylation protein [Thermochaetoides thermophila DSM 1495]
MFSFTPLLGARSESTASQSLLELDGGVKVLIDVGWDESFDPSLLRELEKHVPTLSLILLTHATINHLGAYAHCCKHFPLFTRIPVYATRPVIDLGRTLTQDLYASNPRAATTIPKSSLAETAFAFPQAAGGAELPSSLLLQPPTPDEIIRYFSLIQPLKYSQPHQPLPSPFSPPLNGLTITAYNSGHSLGGTIWHIQHGLESIVYAVDWNQARENVFAGAAWLGGGHGAAVGTEVIEPLRKPTALVCSSRTPDAALPRARRDEQLLESVKLCIARGGTVLIPVDSSARVLELAYLLEHAWRTEVAKENEVFKGTKLYLAGRSVGSTMRNARSMLEWMDDSIVREFEAVAGGARTTNGGANASGGNKAKEAGPFDFKYLRLLERKAQIERVLQQATSPPEGESPKGTVILATDTSLDWGFSKDVLKAIASDARNLVILTEKPNLANPDRPSIARMLWDWWRERRDGVAVEQTASGDTFEQVYGGGRELSVPESTRHPLEGSELTVYQQWLATQRQLQATLRSGGAAGALEASADVVDDASETTTESEESETEQQGKALNVSTTIGQASRKKVVLTDEDLGITILLKKKGVYDFDVRNKKGRERMFPTVLRRKRVDEFGELIRPEDYLRAEEREDEADAAAAANTQDASKPEHNLGKKRKFDDVAAATANTTSPAKRPARRGSIDEGDGALSGPASSDGQPGDELDELEDDEEAVLGPAKLVVAQQTVQVHLRIAFVDFSGLHDKRSLNMLIPLIQPRKLILVGGTEEETLSLAEDCRNLLGAAPSQPEGAEAMPTKTVSADIFTPLLNETINASVDTNAWSVLLTDSFVKHLKWQTVRGLGIVTVTGLLLPPGVEPLSQPAQQQQPQEPDSKRAKLDLSLPVPLTTPETANRSLPTLDILPPQLAGATVRSGGVQPLHVGDLRLADLRRGLLAAGHRAEFRGEGTLLVDGSVVVRKTGAGRVEVESIGLGVNQEEKGGWGTLLAVRRRIYEGLAVVGAA